MITHKKKYGIYHWDTFDNETILLTEFDTFIEATDFVETHYKDRISEDGADMIDIVNKNGIRVKSYRIC